MTTHNNTPKTYSDLIEAVGALMRAEILQAASAPLRTEQRDPDDILMGALLPLLHEGNAGHVERLLGQVEGAQTIEEIQGILADLAAEESTGLAELAEDTLTSLAPRRHAAQTAECLSLAVLAAARRDGLGSLGADDRAHAMSCLRCAAALEADASETEPASEPPRVLPQSLKLERLAKVFAGWSPAALTPALVRDAAAPQGSRVPGAETGRASGRLRDDRLARLGLADAYEYRLAAGEVPSTVVMFLDLRAEPHAEPCELLARLVSPQRGTIAHARVRGRGRTQVRRVKFRALTLEEIDWSAVHVELVPASVEEGL